MNIFAELAHAVYDFKSYPGFRRNKAGKVFLYGFLLSVVYFLISMVLPFLLMFISFGGFGNLAREAIPDFKLENGRLWVAEKYDVEQYDAASGGVCLKIDTDHPITEEITDVDLLAFDQVLVLDAEHAIIKAEGGAAIRVSYENLDLGNWDRETFLENIVPYLPVMVLCIMLLVLCIGLLGFFMGALVVAVIGSIMSAVMGCRLRFGELYKLAIYTRTPALLAGSIYTWLPVVIGFYSVVNYGISAFYMWKALKYIKADQMMPGGPQWTSGV